MPRRKQAKGAKAAKVASSAVTADVVAKRVVHRLRVAARQVRTSVYSNPHGVASAAILSALGSLATAVHTALDALDVAAAPATSGQ